MNMERKEQDRLKKVFGYIPEEELPPAFEAEMMRQIRKEALRIRKRNERLYALTPVAASLAIAGLAAAVFIYMDIPWKHVYFHEISIPPLSRLIGAIVFILLLGDFLFRQAYDKKLRKQDSGKPLSDRF
jgi:hypothetical protein